MQYIIANSWVSSEHGWRVFFTGKAYLPKDTPVSLTDERQRELEDLRVGNDGMGRYGRMEWGGTDEWDGAVRTKRG